MHLCGAGVRQQLLYPGTPICSGEGGSQRMGLLKARGRAYSTAISASVSVCAALRTGLRAPRCSRPLDHTVRVVLAGMLDRDVSLSLLYGLLLCPTTHMVSFGIRLFPSAPGARWWPQAALLGVTSAAVGRGRPGLGQEHQAPATQDGMERLRWEIGLLRFHLPKLDVVEPSPGGLLSCQRTHLRGRYPSQRPTRWVTPGAPPCRRARRAL